MEQLHENMAQKIGIIGSKSMQKFCVLITKQSRPQLAMPGSSDVWTHEHNMNTGAKREQFFFDGNAIISCRLASAGVLSPTFSM